MNKTCKDCRFFQEGMCQKFTIRVKENFSSCNDFADTKLNESFNPEKIQLND